MKKRSVSLALALFMIIGVTTIPVSAGTRASKYLTSYSATTSAGTGGSISVRVNVTGNGRMDEIGATIIKIQESTNGGTTWRTVETYYSDDEPAMLGSGVSFNKTPVSYSGAVNGKLYRAVVTCYAMNSQGSDSADYISNVVTGK